jgi:(1->4)-alpha-D-glucan 1-alpha-D-glucosylmutase
MHVQQFTAPVMAKGVEDTAFYVFQSACFTERRRRRPGRLRHDGRGFHSASADRAANWPHTMLATSTHDSKRSEDARRASTQYPSCPRNGASRFATGRG